MEARSLHTVLRTTHAAYSIELKVHNAQLGCVCFVFSLTGFVISLI